jgi:hypothetical protein
MWGLIKKVKNLSMKKLSSKEEVVAVVLVGK